MKRGVAVHVVVGVFGVVVATLLACAPEDIVIATIPGRDGGPRPTPSARCVQNSDCPDGSFCAMTACDAVGGVCEERPLLCGAAGPPTCGCDDGITYFNDCLRKSHGVRASAPNPCSRDRSPCGGPTGAACPTGASCARLLDVPPGPGPCPRDPPGTCWILPAQCDPAPMGDGWSACGAPVGCVSTCVAAASEAPHRRERSCR